MFLVGLIAWPALEIATFVQVGEWIGWINTILLFMAAGALGLWLLRTEGVSILLRARAQLRDGVAPVDEAFDALCLVLGAILLILPGFLTDVAALVLFFPVTRRVLRHAVMRIAAQQQAVHAGGPMIIEGEFEEVSPRPDEHPGNIVRKRD